MPINVRLLEGLPPYGPPAIAFPEEWGQLGREGTVVEFQAGSTTWAGNFRPGLEGIQVARIHPNKCDAVVIAKGDLWVVDPIQRSAEYLLPCVFEMLDVREPEGWIFSRQGLSLVRFGPSGIMWRTRRLSVDGFDQLRIDQSEVKGLAYSPPERWVPFRVDLSTGRSTGGVFLDDLERWKRQLP